MKQYFKKLEKQFKFQCKVFNFWIGIAQKANQKAAAANMKCKMLTEEMTEVSQKILDENEETSNMSQVEL